MFSPILIIKMIFYDYLSMSYIIPNNFLKKLTGNSRELNKQILLISKTNLVLLFSGTDKLTPHSR